MSEQWTPLELVVSAEPGTVVEARAGDVALAAVQHEGQWRVFLDMCTHAECAFTDYGEVSPDDGALICNCHGAEFALTDGSVLLEPAEEPLVLLPVRATEDGSLEVQLGAGAAGGA